MVGTVIRSFPSPGGGPVGLTFDGRCLWNADLVTGLIYQIDPETGTVIRSVASPATASKGLTFDGRCLWITDVGADRIYQLSAL